MSERPNPSGYMVTDKTAAFPGPWRWLVLCVLVFSLVGLVFSLVGMTVTFGPAGLVVYALLLFASYRLGKAVGR